METISQLLLYFFNPNPGRTFNYDLALEIFTGLLIVFAIFLKIYIKKNRQDKSFRRLMRDYPGKFILVGVLLAIYLFCRFNMIPFLSMRIMLYIIVAVGVYLIYGVTNTYLNKYPQMKKMHEEHLAKTKYLPKRHKKG